MPGNWGTVEAAATTAAADADSDVDVELGREIVSRFVCGNARVARAVASSMTSRKEGRS